MSRINKFERNLIINGGMELWQRGTSLAATNFQRVADRHVMGVQGTGSLEATQTQNADLPPGHFSGYSLNFENTGGVPADTASTFIGYNYRMEGYDFDEWINRLNSKLYIQFWAKSNQAQTYSVCMQSADFQQYITDFTIDAADTWQLIKVLIPRPPSPSAIWTGAENALGGRLVITLASGPDFDSPNVDQWYTAGNEVASPNVGYGFNVVGRYFRLAKMQMIVVEENFRSDAFDELPFRRAGRNFAEEVILAQRYFEKSYALDVDPDTATDLNEVFGIGTPMGKYGGAIGLDRMDIKYKVEKRAVATATTYSSNGAGPDTYRNYNAASNPGVVYRMQGTQGFYVSFASIASGQSAGFQWTASAEL